MRRRNAERLRAVMKQSAVLVTARVTWQAANSYAWDMGRYFSQSGMYRSERVPVLEAQIVMDYHRIEKGLALAAPKAWFGRDTVERLLRNSARLLKEDGPDVSILNSAIGSLEAYEKTFSSTPCDWWAAPRDDLRKLRAMIERDLGLPGGTEAYETQGPPTEGSRTFSDLARMRSSVRNFSDEIVDEDVLQAAISTAQYTPSVCNRQAARVRTFERGDAATELLKLQNGNRGFGSDASHVLLVTADVSQFLTPGERNQAYIDGGMYAMSLVYALQDLGVDSCCLNWSTIRSQDRRLRRHIQLPGEELVVMMIAVGYARAGAVVTISPRRSHGRVNLASGGVV